MATEKTKKIEAGAEGYSAKNIDVLEGLDATFAIMQMPPGIPVATVAINGALNAAVLALQIMANGNKELQEKIIQYKKGLKNKIVKANNDLAEIKFRYKTN